VHHQHLATAEVKEEVLATPVQTGYFPADDAGTELISRGPAHHAVPEQSDTNNPVAEDIRQQFVLNRFYFRQFRHRYSS